MENDQNNQNSPNTQNPPNPISAEVENSDAIDQVPTMPAQAPTESAQVPSDNLQNPGQAQVQNSPNPTGSIVTPPSKGSNKLLLVGLILLIIAAVTVAIYFFFQNNKSSVSVEIKPTPTISQKLPSPTPDPTENWETHKSSIYQVKYPNDLISGGDESMLNISKWGPTQTEGTELFDGYAITIIQKEDLNTTPEEYAQTLISEAESMGVSEITQSPTAIVINNYNGVTYTEEGLGTFKHIILTSNDNSTLVQISIMVSDPGNLRFQETVDDILSTFQFLPQE